MSKWNLIFDAERCNSCNNCVLATKDEYLGNRFEGYTEPAPKLGNLWFKLQRRERGKAPMIDVTHYVETCHQCANAPCITKTTRDVIKQRADGIVVIDPAKAKGRRDLVDACPYGQIYWNEEQDLPQKYSLDAHLLDAGWPEPRAVQACPTQALTIAKLDDKAMAERAEAEGLINLRPELGARPRIWYRNADRLTHHFLGGTLVRDNEGREDCAEGVTVRLYAEDETVRDAVSDAFGDFKFESLEGKGEKYRLVVLAGDQNVAFEREFSLSGSQWIGLIEVA
jgi:Fe-S-cluster-containing dehydrogenase component